MQIKKEDRFKSEFRNILEYIAKDNLSSAKKFKKDLIKEIKKISEYPYKYRASNLKKSIDLFNCLLQKAFKGELI